MKKNQKIILPKERKLDETENIALPVVKCSVCGNLTTQGLHQVRLKLVKPGRWQKHKITGALRRIPAVMKREDVYMCTLCVGRGKKWPGKKPT